MKKPVVVSLLVALAFLAGRYSYQSPVEAQARGGEPASECADLNADGSVDISDAVYLLSHLFLGGSAPICPEPRVLGLPDTGVSNCVVDEFGFIGCQAETCAGQDGFYETGCPSEGRFIDNGDGTVTDTCTGLMWQRDTTESLNWCAAVSHCENLEFAGHDDWRLPNVRELHSIVDYGRYNPSADPIFDTLGLEYWTSTYWDLEDAYVVDFHDGQVITQVTGIAQPVRAVRTVQPE